MPAQDQPTARVRVAAVVLRDEHGLVLTVRKRGTSRFMLPGGKYEPGETAAQTAARELGEEVRVRVAPEALVPLGSFTAAAANEADTTVEAEVFTAPPALVPGPGGEIEELRWIPLDGPPDDLAPMLVDGVLPLLRARAG